MRCVYTSATPSLAILENLVHIDLDTAPRFFLYSLEVDIHQISVLPNLSNGWQKNYLLNPLHKDISSIKIIEH